MKKTLILGAALGATLGGAAVAQDFIYGSWPPASDYLNTDTLPGAFDIISEETGGEVTWELIAGGQLADPRGTLAQVGDDLMQSGLAIPVYTPGAMPTLTLLYSIVVPGNDPVATAGAAAETVFLNCPECLADAKDNNVLPLGGFASASYRLMCTSPVASVADMEGKRIRATGGYGEMTAMGGGIPTSTTLPESVGLLQKGGLDCLMASREWLKTFGYGEYAKHVTDLPLGTTAPALGFVMNYDAFADLSTEAKSAHLRASAYVTAKHTIGNYVVKDEETFQAQVAENGVAYVEPEADLVALVEGFAEADRDRLIENAEQLGVSDPATLIDTYFAAVEKWQGISQEIGPDVDAFAEKLWDEVYSKLDPDAL